MYTKGCIECILKAVLSEDCYRVYTEDCTKDSCVYSELRIV